jgi:hypothetical protein
MALAAAVAGRGCNANDDSPEGVVRSLDAAARAGDRKAIYELLGPRTRKALHERTQRATELVGGARRFEPLELISLTTPGEPARIKSLHVSKSGGETHVIVTDVSGRVSRIPVVEVDGHWRVELPGYLPKDDGAKQ